MGAVIYLTEHQIEVTAERISRYVNFLKIQIGL